MTAIESIAAAERRVDGLWAGVQSGDVDSLVVS